VPVKLNVNGAAVPEVGYTVSPSAICQGTPVSCALVEYGAANVPLSADGEAANPLAVTRTSSLAAAVLGGEPELLMLLDDPVEDAASDCEMPAVHVVPPLHSARMTSDVDGDPPR